MYRLFGRKGWGSAIVESQLAAARAVYEKMLTKP